MSTRKQRRSCSSAGFRITLSTWTLTMKSGVLLPEHLAEIERMGTPLSEFFLTVNAATFEYVRSRHGATLSTHPDSLTCACMIDESLILEAAECFVDVETAGELTRGYCSVSSPILPDHDLADPGLPRAQAKRPGHQDRRYGAVWQNGGRGAGLARDGCAFRRGRTNRRAECPSPRPATPIRKT